jgi:hypothetical protein
MPGQSISTAPKFDDCLLRPFRAGRVYCNATQAKAWAKFPRPFGPKPAPKFDRLPGYLEWQFAIAPDARLSPAPNESQDLIPRL